MLKKKGKEQKVDAYAGRPFSRVVGIDVANSTIKIWTDNDVHKEYRNTVREINDAGLVYSFKTNYQMYVLDKEVYEVGDLSAMGSGGRGKARYNSKAFRIEALIGIAGVLQPGTNEKIRVVTGLPSSLSKNAAIAEEIKKNLIGEFSIKSVKWDQVEDITFEIVDVIVVPQPLGTLYNFVYDEKEQALNQKFLSQRALIVDIGWGTTDLAVLEESRVRGTFGFEIGVSDYVANLQEDVNDKMPEANIYALNSHQLDIALLESTTVETPFGKFDLAQLAEKHKEIQSRRVYEAVMGLGLEFTKFYRIILTGGGALQYEKYLRTLFNDPRLIIQQDAVTANAKGFHLLGQF
ncbi:MAG: ParM/StbA family protein [Firmicutes bacterium]|nr:ParM/StbA family protein [Bacillota bacterium]